MEERGGRDSSRNERREGWGWGRNNGTKQAKGLILHRRNNDDFAEKKT